MSSIWTTSDDGWTLLAPSGFPDEATLHSLVEEAPQLLPLAGEPQLVIVGREVPIGGGYADLVAVEPSGRLAIIEVKLASNAESRRAVVAQILGYAAFMRGTPLDELQNNILKSNLAKRGLTSIGNAVEEVDQTGSYQLEAFELGVSESLASGRFRLVLVLDDAPPELVRIVGYLESLAPELVIDLVTVAAYEVSGQRVLVPQRVEPGDSKRQPAPTAKTLAPGGNAQGHLIDPEDFERSISSAAESEQPLLRRMFEWAKALEAEGLVRLLGYRGTTGRTTLLPYLPNDDAGLVTVWNDTTAYISLWRSVFERHVPELIPRIEALTAPVQLGKGRSIKNVSDELLVALTDAYRRAAPQSPIGPASPPPS